MSLKSRIDAFGVVSSRFENNKIDDLLLEHKIHDKLFKRLQIATAMYISKSVGDKECEVDEDSLIQLLDEKSSEVQNITPNGMVVPKRHLVLEYNLLVSSFAAIIDSLKINDLISSWHIPLNLRYKQGEVNQDNMQRHHPTEHIHSDSWAGESSESVTVMIPIFGDVERNHVSFYKPPEDFEEGWLGPLPTYLDGKKYADRYSKIDFVPTKGSLILSDFAGLHSSSRLPSAGSRLSIDTTFVLKKPGDDREPEKIHEWREGERAVPDILSSLGGSKLLYFPDSSDEWVDSQGGFKHPTNLQVVEL
jgi:hypothetical protein